MTLQRLTPATRPGLAWSALPALALLWLALAWLLLAAPARAGKLPGELPGLVGQLTALQGDVRWYDRDSASWQAGTDQPLRNWPLTAGDRLRTGANARAELRVGSTTLRLGADVELTLQQLDEQGLGVWLQSGSVAISLPPSRPGDAGTVELLTPEGRWLPQRPGHYRLDRQPAARTPATQATAWRGEWRFEGPDSALLIPPGRRADLWQDRQTGGTRFAWAPVDRDAFADWVARDERQDDAPLSARHVPPGMSGWQELDRHGDWVNHPELGSVWQPRAVAPGWAPYQDGRWAWVAPWGWTWIDAAPWGFAPFHYGSWMVFGGRWCWSPGPRHVRARFAPALSPWVSGPHLGVGIQIGGGYRPPPPRVVMPVMPPPRAVVVLPAPPYHPPHGPPHRPHHHADPQGHGWHMGRDSDDRRDGPPPRGREDRPGRADRPERVERPEWAERPGRPYLHERQERHERVERPERPERQERQERPERPERQHGAERVQRMVPAGPVQPSQTPASPMPASPVRAVPVPVTAVLPAVPPVAVRPELPAAAEVRSRAPSAGQPGRDGRAERPDRSDIPARQARHEPMALR